MTKLFLRCACTAAAALPLAGGAGVLAAAPAQATIVRPIQPNQYFTGATNGRMGTDTVLVICPGGLRSGHPASGQTVVVHQGVTTSRSGFTGSRGNRIAVSFPGPSTSGPLIVQAYDVPVAIPTTLTLPCGTKATVRFAPLPTSRSARPDLVQVAFDPGPALRK